MYYFIFNVTSLCLSVVPISYIQYWFVYIDKNDFSDKEKTVFWRPKEAIFQKTHKVAFSWRPEKTSFGDRQYRFFFCDMKNLFSEFDITEKTIFE